MHDIRVVLAEFTEQLALMSVVGHPAEDLEKDVGNAMAGSAVARHARLAKAPRKPSSTARLLVEFNRNPDVVAEVLVRAGCVCVGSGNPASFTGAKDCTPYLEVHQSSSWRIAVMTPWRMRWRRTPTVTASAITESSNRPSNLSDLGLPSCQSPTGC